MRCGSGRMLGWLDKWCCGMLLVSIELLELERERKEVYTASRERKSWKEKNLEQNPARSDIAMRFVVASRASVPEPGKFPAGIGPPIGVLRN